MGLFKIVRADGKSMRLTKAEAREIRRKGGIDRNGYAVMGRTDKHGRPLGLFSRRSK
jgi:hypothetical protein